MKASDLFEIPDSIPFKDDFNPDAAPWEWVAQIKLSLKEAALPDIADLMDRGRDGLSISGPVYIDNTVKLPPFARIEGPAWIGPNVEIRPGAYIRGNVIVGPGSVLGNSCEYKNCLLLEKVQTPHYNYVGDSILGNRTHLGAGVILSNLRLDQKNIRAYTSQGRNDTGMRKLGAMLGDEAEVGSNATIQPGTILGKRGLVMPQLSFGGYLPPNTVAGSAVRIETRPRV